MDLVKKMILSQKQSVNALSTSYVQVLQKGHPDSMGRRLCQNGARKFAR